MAKGRKERTPRPPPEARGLSSQRAGPACGASSAGPAPPNADASSPGSLTRRSTAGERERRSLEDYESLHFLDSLVPNDDFKPFEGYQAMLGEITWLANRGVEIFRLEPRCSRGD